VSPVLAGIVALVVAVLVTPLVRSAARRWGFLDRPNERSSHTGIVPRAGGVAILVAVGLVLAVARGLWWPRRAAVTGVGIAIAAPDPFASLLGAAVAGAATGFLAFNWSPATIFLGDVGSGAVGFTLAVLPFVAVSDARPHMVLFVALSLWLFLADATFTLLRRRKPWDYHSMKIVILDTSEPRPQIVGRRMREMYQFPSLHPLFETMATALAAHNDAIAERAVTLGGQALGTVRHVAGASRLPEYPLDATRDLDHVRLLAERIEVYLEGLRESRAEAEKAGDPDTVDLLTGAILDFEKHDWFLRASLAA
jgi:starvation-inducible DNA-binding protein